MNFDNGMATSSSDGSCEAPADFHLSLSIDDIGSRCSSTLGKCPLCRSLRKTFYCKQCIRNGDFLHSKFTHSFYKRFADKQLQLLRLVNEKCQIEKLCEDRLWGRIRANKLKCEADACKERIRLLKLIVHETKNSIAKGRIDVNELGEQNKKRRSRLPRYEERVNRLENYVDSMALNVEKRQLAVRQIRDELKQIVRRSVQQLVEFIFPISSVPPAESEEDVEIKDTVSALAEATRTAYVKGRWVFTDSSGELQHCIVAPTLPESGDYSAYNIWVAANRDGVPSANTETIVQNSAYNISAALTYTTQLTNVLAFYLDIWLPAKLNYSDFCSHELSDNQFARRVARLNSNILHLCFSQKVSPELLRPAHTLENILHLLNTQVSDLGRYGPFEVDSHLVKALEDQLARELSQNEDTDSEDESDNLPLEWEAVPHVTYPESSSGPGSLTSQHNPSSSHQATSMAGGLMTSAAASIASLWRGWTGNR